MNINTVVARQRRELEYTIKEMRSHILILERQIKQDDYTEQQISRKQLKLLNEQFNLLTTLLTLLNSKGE